MNGGTIGRMANDPSSSGPGTELDVDAPITVLSQDRFQFDRFAKDLADIIVNRSDKDTSCFTFYSGSVVKTVSGSVYGGLRELGYNCACPGIQICALAC